MYRDGELVIRPIEEEDLYDVWALIFKEETPEWKKWDAPYYPHSALRYEDFLRGSAPWVNKDSRWLVEVDGAAVGTVSYYWEDEASNWLEIGIVLYQSENWSCGLGTRTLKMWIEHLFNTLRSEEHTSELQSRGHLVCRLLLEKKKILLQLDTW